MSIKKLILSSVKIQQPLHKAESRDTFVVTSQNGEKQRRKNLITFMFEFVDSWNCLIKPQTNKIKASKFFSLFCLFLCNVSWCRNKAHHVFLQSTVGVWLVIDIHAVCINCVKLLNTIIPKQSETSVQFQVSKLQSFVNILSCVW